MEREDFGVGWTFIEVIIPSRYLRRLEWVDRVFVIW
jgi:hypothetical protein